MLSPRVGSLDRRGSAFLDAAPGTANRATGSGWGHWGSGSGGAGEAAGSGGAAAAAGGTAAEKRGAGMGQELITPLQVDPSIDFDQVRVSLTYGKGYGLGCMLRQTEVACLPQSTATRGCLAVIQWSSVLVLLLRPAGCGLLP